MNMLTRRRFLQGLAASAVAAPATRGDNDDFPPARAVTRGPKHHFFGYYDKCPWDATGRYLLAMEIDFRDRQPKPGEPLTLGMVDLKDNDRYVPFDTTLAWCWQQGTMLQWLPGAADREVIYNSVADGQYVAVIRDVHSGKARRLPRPVYAVAPDGKQAVTLDFDRLGRLRPGYGYLAVEEKYKDDPAPKDAGIYHLDLETGKHRLIVSIAQAAANQPDERFRGAMHWFNHLQFNPSSSRFLFLHRWRPALDKPWQTRLYTAKPDGGDLKLVIDTGMVSHFDWRDDDTILAWTRTKDRGDRFYLIDTRTREMTVVGEGVLTRDGHCSYSSDRKWVLNDTYPDDRRLQTLMLYRPADGKRIDVGRFHLPLKLAGPFRCDLHPRWDRDGTQVCIDSAHEETRQVYVLDVGRVVWGG